MDSFGGAFSIVGDGQPDAAGAGFTVDYHYPDSTYVNRFRREGPGWRWTITEEAAGKPDKAFASYELAPASCEGMTFAF